MNVSTPLKIGLGTSGIWAAWVAYQVINVVAVNAKSLDKMYYSIYVGCINKV
jgi:hypothetical protein